jgi:hypothetical protein
LLQKELEHKMKALWVRREKVWPIEEGKAFPPG